MPFYAVRAGRLPGIYDTWNECKDQVTGYPKAAYKKFDSRHDAEEFVGAGSSSRSKAANSSKLLGVKKTTLKSKDDVKKPLKKTKLIDTSDTLRHQFIKRENLPKSAVVYTDGCCLNNGFANPKGGIGVYWAPHHPMNISEPLLVDAPTNNKAELVAASRALEQAIGIGLTSIELRTDSKYTIQAMTEWMKNWEANGWKTSKNTDVVNKNLMINLADLCKRISITWVHVDAHVGIYGNEQADRLANEGALLQNSEKR